jgi:hypothetical protein
MVRTELVRNILRAGRETAAEGEAGAKRFFAIIQFTAKKSPENANFLYN